MPTTLSHLLTSISEPLYALTEAAILTIICFFILFLLYALLIFDFSLDRSNSQFLSLFSCSLPLLPTCCPKCRNSSFSSLSSYSFLSLSTPIPSTIPATFLQSLSLPSLPSLNFSYFEFFSIYLDYLWLAAEDKKCGAKIVKGNLIVKRGCIRSSDNT